MKVAALKEPTVRMMMTATVVVPAAKKKSVSSGAPMTTIVRVDRPADWSAASALKPRCVKRTVIVSRVGFAWQGPAPSRVSTVMSA